MKIIITLAAVICLTSCGLVTGALTYADPATGSKGGINFSEGKPSGYFRASAAKDALELEIRSDWKNQNAKLISVLEKLDPDS